MRSYTVNVSIANLQSHLEQYVRLAIREISKQLDSLFLELTFINGLDLGRSGRVSERILASSLGENLGPKDKDAPHT